MHQNFTPPSTPTSPTSTGHTPSNSSTCQRNSAKRLGPGTNKETGKSTTAYVGTKHRFSEELTSEELTEFYYLKGKTYEFIEGRFFRNGHIINGLMTDFPIEGEKAWFFNGMMVAEKYFTKLQNLQESGRTKEITRWLLEEALLFPTCFKVIDFDPFYLYRKGMMRNVWCGVSKSYYTIPCSGSELVFNPEYPVLIGINFNEDEDIVEQMENLKEDIKFTLADIKKQLNSLSEEFDKLKGSDEELKDIWQVVKTLKVIVNSEQVKKYESATSSS
jgi:hypothetical protein